MKSSTVFVAALAAAALTSIALSANAQMGQTPAAAPPPAATPAAPVAASDAAKPPADDKAPPADQKADANAQPAGTMDNTKPADKKPVPLTKQETAQAVDLLGAKCTVCHDANTITSLKNDKAGWEGILGSMGPNAELDQTQTDLIVKYLTENYGL